MGKGKGKRGYCFWFVFFVCTSLSVLNFGCGDNFQNYARKILIVDEMERVIKVIAMCLRVNVVHHAMSRLILTQMSIDTHIRYFKQ